MMRCQLIPRDGEDKLSGKQKRQIFYMRKNRQKAKGVMHEMRS